MATCLVEADISRMRERKCPQRVSGALPIRKEHAEIVGESIVQILLFASIILCTRGSAVPVYGCIHPVKSSSRPVERNEPHRCAREARQASKVQVSSKDKEQFYATRKDQADRSRQE